MFTNNMIQDSVLLIESNDNEISSSSNDTVQYGPIRVRICRKAAPTIATGRRSKHLILVGEEAIQREKRREKNREAAKKLKEKRQLIEEKLHEKLKYLENQYLVLQNYLQHLYQKKQILQNEINNISIDSTNDISSFFQQHSNDLDLFDESIDRIFNSDLDIHFQL